MSTYTTNYNLEKPDSTDDFKDFRSNYNSNMDIIDANLGGGGGGNVDDVLVNGVSVVDGNHDAQITSYKEVTQAEYDALPATKLTDNIAYFIKDAGGGGGGSSSHDYSTTEQVIGTWIDGKPVYEMVFEIASLPNTTTTEYSPNISNFGEWVTCGCSGEIIFASGNKAPLPYFHTGNFSANSINIQYNTNGKVQIQTGTDRTNASAKFVLQYTKTTD